jgi:hypothetical protein
MPAESFIVESTQKWHEVGSCMIVEVQIWRRKAAADFRLKPSLASGLPVSSGILLPGIPSALSSYTVEAPACRFQKMHVRTE